MLEGSTQALLRILEEQESRLSPQAVENLKTWLGDREYAPFVPEIAGLIAGARWEDLEDSFYAHLTIGTGGIRGPLGVGPNRVNLRTIGEAAQGLCHFIEDYGPEAKQSGVVVGHEARKGSKDFAILCCEVFAANGIRSFLFDSLRATPEISFAVRYLNATAGVQITASHNPRTDNGFKFYWSDGAQVLPPHDTKFMQLVSEVRQIRRMPLSEAQGKGLVSGIGKEVDEPYFQAIRGLSTNSNRSADIVFSPIHGAGASNVLPVLQAENFQVTRVLEQIEPDENFPTAHGDLINPEFREVMELPMRIAEELGADVAICSDPDADRVGVAAKINWDSSKVEFLTGNQVGVALTEYLLTHRSRAGLGSERDLILETFVTTSLISDIASQGFGLTPRNDLLVGFKFIAQIIGEMNNPSDFVFGAEESLGYLAGDFVRDKDAAIASLLICEMVSWLKDQGKTLPMYLDDIYRRYGYYKNLQLLVELPGKTGLEIMRTVMLYLRHAPPEEVAGVPVVKVIDRLDEAQRAPDGYRLGGSGDMLSFCLSEDLRSRITIRPSGTEPKLKCYVQHYGPDAAGDLVGVKSVIDTAAHALGAGLLQYGYRGLPGELQKEWDRSTQKAL